MHPGPFVLQPTNAFRRALTLQMAAAVTDGNNYKKSYYGTISYLPCLFGLHAASLVIRCRAPRGEEVMER
eukprot:1646713-Rhodomonas_salina.1